jgi:hypothetical protein
VAYLGTISGGLLNNQNLGYSSSIERSVFAEMEIFVSDNTRLSSSTEYYANQQRAIVASGLFDWHSGKALREIVLMNNSNYFLISGNVNLEATFVNYAKVDIAYSGVLNVESSGRIKIVDNGVLSGKGSIVFKNNSTFEPSFQQEVAEIDIDGSAALSGKVNITRMYDAGTEFAILRAKGGITGQWTIVSPLTFSSFPVGRISADGTEYLISFGGQCLSELKESEIFNVTGDIPFTLGVSTDNSVNVTQIRKMGTGSLIIEEKTTRSTVRVEEGQLIINKTDIIGNDLHVASSASFIMTGTGKPVSAPQNLSHFAAFVASGLNYTVGNIHNDGIVKFEQLGSRITASKNLTGSGDFHLNIDIMAGEANTVVIQGTSSGSHEILFSNSGTVPTEPDAQILVVSTQGGSGIFSGTIKVGKIRYGVVNGATIGKNGNDWYLVALEVEQEPTPAILAQPPYTQIVSIGGEVNFSVIPQGDISEFVYQWQKLAVDGVTWKNISSSTNATFRISAATISDSGAYRVGILNTQSGLYGTFGPYMLTVNSVPLTGNRNALKDLLDATNALLAGAVVGEGTGQYSAAEKAAIEVAIVVAQVVFYDAAATQAEIDAAVAALDSAKNTFTHSVNGGRGDGGNSLKITHAPGNKNVLEGEAVNFTVVATGSGGLTYKWFHNGQEIAGATSATLALGCVASKDAGNYQVVVCDVTGASITSESAILTVTSYALFGLSTKGVKLTAPKDLLVPKGTKLLRGTKAVYVWTDGAGNIVTDAKGKAISGKSLTTKVSGEFTVTLKYTPIDPMSKAALPEVSVPYRFGKVKIFTAAKISGFFAEPVPGATVTGVANSVVKGESLRLTVTLQSGTGTGPLNYLWLKGKDVVGRTENTYELTDSFTTPAFGDKTDSYTVVVETVERDAKGTKPLSSVKSKAIKPTVIIPPSVTITTSEAKRSNLAAGKTVSLTTKATGTAKLLYRWEKDGVVIPGADKSSYKAAESGEYTVRVTNPAGEKYAVSATVSVTFAGASGGANLRLASGTSELPGLAGGSAVALYRNTGILSPGSVTVRPGSAGILPALGASSANSGDVTGGQVENLFSFAPAALVAGTVLDLDEGAAVLEIFSAVELSNGTYAYERQSATTARLSYVVFAEDSAVESGEIQLEFTSSTGGIYTHIAGDGEVESGVFALSTGERTGSK